MSVTVHRSTRGDAMLPSLILTSVRPVEISLDIVTSLASSLSGSLTDYIIKEVEPYTCVDGPVWSVSAKPSHQQRLLERRQKLCLSEERFREAEETLLLMDHDREICIATMKVYMCLDKSMILTHSL